jgi:hypothetical protein
MLGTPDGYNTETSKRLHIDFAKMGYQVSNRVNAIKQMAVYIQRVEAIAMHEEYLEETTQRRSRDAWPQELADRDLTDEFDNTEDEEDKWDEWEDEDNLDDPEELNDIGIRVRLAMRLDEFLNDGPVRMGGKWEEEPSKPGETNNHGPQWFHPSPELVTAQTPTTTSISLNNLQNMNNSSHIQQSLHAYMQKTQSNLSYQQIQNVLPLTTKVKTWSCTCLFHSAPPFKPLEGPH